MPSEIIKAVEESWHSESIEEDFYFGLSDPTKLRRSKKITGALAGLTFGQYKGMDGAWIDDDKVIWLAMIVSDVPGSGRELINCLTKSFSKYGISLVGDPFPLKPTAWCAERKWQPKLLIGWYMRRGFKIIQDKDVTRVIHLALSSSIKVKFEF